MYARGPDFNPWDALGLDPRDRTITEETVKKAWRRVHLHVFHDRPGTRGVVFPSPTQANVARDYFIEGQQMDRLQREWILRHRSTWNPYAPRGSVDVHRPIPPPPLPADPSASASASTSAPASASASARTSVPEASSSASNPGPRPEKRAAPEEDESTPASEPKRARTQTALPRSRSNPKQKANIAAMRQDPARRPWSGYSLPLGTWSKSPLPPELAHVVLGSFDRRGRFTRRVVNYSLDGRPIIGGDIRRASAVPRREIGFLPQFMGLTEERLRGEVSRLPSTRAPPARR